MKAVENQFLTFLDGKKQFIIPIYQRTYSWSREQCEQLWNDIVRTATDNTVTGHFIGSIVYIQHGLYVGANVMSLLVIDGQQRLTTLTLLLIALAKAARDADNISHEDIYDSYLINKYGKDEQHYKLLLTQSDKDTLIQLIDDPDRAKSIERGNRLLENYLYFENRIRQSAIDPSMLYLGISKLLVVEISLNKDHDNPQLIFESLNSTGMDLSQADLIRNYVLMGFDNEEQTTLYKKYWYPMEQSFGHAQNVALFNRFMRDYLTMKSKSGEIPNIDKVYMTFKTYQQSRNTTSIGEIVADIYRYSKYFTKMALSQEQDTEIKQVIDDINWLQVYVAYPFLLEVYDDYEHQLLTRDDFIAILKLIESYVFRRAICGIPTNALNKIFATLAKEITKEHYLESVQAALLQKGAGGRFPRDEEFRAEFVVKNMYNFRNRNYLLSKLENYDRRKEQINVEKYTIEHIMPQNENLSDEWQQELGLNWKELHSLYLHTIGNLTLTGYNSELSDHSFQKKHDMDGGFADSPIRLNRSLARLEHWNEDEIKKRAQALADLAVKVWSIPQLSAGQVSKYRQTQRSPLAEVIGPVNHPLASFIPEGFKVIQISEKYFYYFRYVGEEWIQYGNGKRAWYATSWENVGRWIREFSRTNTMPLGTGGTQIKAEAEILAEYTDGEEVNGSKSYSLEDYPGLQGTMREVFEQLRKRILNLDAAVREEHKKNYIAYKTTTNFVDIEPQKKRLRLSLNMKFSEINDPKGLCKDLTGMGHWGNGDIEISVTSLDQLDDVMDLVRQSFEIHWDEAYA